MDTAREHGYCVPSTRVDGPLLIMTSFLLAERVKAKFRYAIHVADLVADLRVHVVCVSQTGRKLVESQLRTGLRPGSSYLDMSK